MLKSSITKHLLFYLVTFNLLQGHSQAVEVAIDFGKEYQTIDGFGSIQSGNPNYNKAEWWQNLYYDDLGCSIYRMDLTPKLMAPYSDFNYYSPWFMGSATKDLLNIEDSANPNGPENNRVRTYTGAKEYSRTFGGRNAPIAIMGPDIENNIKLFNFNYAEIDAIQEGAKRKIELGDFKLIGSLWSPLPWLKMSSGNTYNNDWWPGPVKGVMWPFIWGGNFAGGKLDVSEQALEIFNDGREPTSALVQFARSVAAHLMGLQRASGVPFYAISIQNELNFEEFYNSCTYPLSDQYLKALKAVRKELDKYPELQGIRIMGPEDLLGGDAYGMWQYGGRNSTVHKNLQYLKAIGADAEASKAIDYFCIHGYDANGVSSAGSNSKVWDWWANGWTTSPAAGIPEIAKGFTSFGKKSWMTETSGEGIEWLLPKGGFPGGGAWSIGLKIHKALTAGMQSAWLYWTFAESENDGSPTTTSLTSINAKLTSPKYNAAKHFYKYIRPNAIRVEAISGNKADILASAYVHKENKTITCVLINQSSVAKTVNVSFSGNFDLPLFMESYTSYEANYWLENKANVVDQKLSLEVPAYGIMTLYGKDLINNTTANKETCDYSLEVAPNPTSGMLQLTYTLEKSSNITIAVSDGQGKLIYEQNYGKQTNGNQTKEIDLTPLSPGMYFVTVYGDHKKIVKKVAVFH